MPSDRFLSLQMSAQETIDMHRAIMMHWMVEDHLRQVHGLEGIEPPMILERLETLLNMSHEEAHTLFHQIENGLQTFSWTSYAEEWAWRRAEEDVKQTLGQKSRYMKEEKFDALVEDRYRKDFENYAAEIDVDNDQAIKRIIKKTRAKRDVI